MRGRRRPWRAIAYIPDPTAPNGRVRNVAGRVAACDRLGLRAFIQRHKALGHEVDVYLNAELVPSESVSGGAAGPSPAPQHTSTTAAAWADADAELQEAYARLDAADRGEWERNVILQAIRHCAEQGAPFSANDVRPLLPEVNTNRIGRCFALAAEQGSIEFVGYVKSTDRGTHGKRIAVWRRPASQAVAS